MESLRQDLRHALRVLRKQPTFTATVVLTLALATGANTGAFTLVYGTLSRPLPIPNADRLVALSTRHSSLGSEIGELSLADLEDVRAGCSSCAEVAGVEESNLVISGIRRSARLRGSAVSPGLFRALGIHPGLGRLPTASTTHTETLISHRFWQRELGEDPNVLGRGILLNGEPRTIVGVMPPGFHFPERSDFWVGFRPDSQASRSQRNLDGAYALLQPGVAIEQMRSEMAVLSQRLEASFPATNNGWSIIVDPLRTAMVGRDTRQVLYLMAVAVLFVLLIACSNVANLLLSHQSRRRQDLAIRTALGCHRWRMMQQLASESLLLSLFGSALGLLFATWIVDYVRTSSPDGLPYWMRFEIDSKVLLFTLGLSAVTTVLIGILPALRAIRPELYTVLRGGGKSMEGPTRQRLQRLLVAGQIALALILIFGAGLLIRTSLAMTAADPGFEPRNLVTLRTLLVGERYDEPDARIAWMEDAAEKLEAIPGIARAAFTGSLPLDEGGADALLRAEVNPQGSENELPGIYVSTAAGLWDTLDVPMVRGRSFSENEIRDPAARVALVNPNLASKLWPGKNPLGQRLQVGAQVDAPWYTVVGVANELHYDELGEQSARTHNQVHLPYASAPWRSMSLLVRTEIEPSLLLEPMRQAISSLDPNLAIYDLRTLDQVRHQTTWGSRIRSEIFGSFALIALVLGAVGVYGVISFSVSQRRHEIGVRMALGADRSTVRRMVVREGLMLASIGVIAGLGGAVLVARVMHNVVWGIHPSDPSGFVVAVSILLGVALAASYLPAHRAGTVDPMTSLRSE